MRRKAPVLHKLCRISGQSTSRTAHHGARPDLTQGKVYRKLFVKQALYDSVLMNCRFALKIPSIVIMFQSLTLFDGANTGRFRYERR